MSTPYRDAGLFVLTAAVSGSVFVAIKIGVGIAPPVLLAAFRYDLTAIALLAIGGLVYDRWRPRTRQDLFGILFGGGFLIAANNSLLFLGQQYTTSAVAAVTHSLNPILTMLVAYVALPKTRPTPIDVLGIVLGLGGVAVMARPSPSNVVTGSRGIILILLAASSLALGSVALRRLDTSLPSIVITGWASALGAGLMHFVSLALGESPTAVSWTPTAIVVLLFLAGPGGVVAYGGYFYLIDRIGPTQSNLISYVAPLFAAVSGWFVLRESIQVFTAVGLCLIIGGFLLIKRRAIATEFGTVSALLFAGYLVVRAQEYAAVLI